MAMKKQRDEAQVERMRKMGYTDDEIEEMLADDDTIDRTSNSKYEKVFDWELDPEEHKKAVKNANVEQRKPGAGRSKERKPNPDKREIIEMLYQTLFDAGFENVVIKNPERFITFDNEGDNYEIMLTCHRPKDKEKKPKKKQREAIPANRQGNDGKPY